MNPIIEEDLLGVLERVELGKLMNKSILVTGSNGLIGLYNSCCYVCSTSEIFGE